MRMPLTETALKQITEAFKSNPKDNTAFKALETEYSQSQSRKKLLELYLCRAEAIKNEDAPKAADLFFKSGEIQEKELGEKEAARTSYQTAFQLQPRQKNYGEVLINLYTNESNWNKCLEVLRRQLEIASKNDEKISLLGKIAEIFRDRVLNVNESKKYFRQILEIDSRNQEALNSLDKLYTKDKQWVELLEICQIGFKNSSDTVSKIKWLERCGNTCIEIPDLAKAISFFNQIIDIAPDNLTTLKRLENLHITQKNWPELIAILQKQLKFYPKPEEKNKLLLHIAQTWQEQLTNLSEAIKFYEQSLACEETDSILKTLESNYIAQKNWVKLSDIYERQSKRTQDIAIQNDLYCKIGKLAKDELQDIAKAIRWYKTAQEQNPKNIDLLRILQELYKKANDYKKLEEVYRLEIELLDEKNESDKITIFYKIAEIYRDLKDPKTQANIYEEVIQKYPSHYPTIENLKAIYTNLANYPALIKILQHEISLKAGKSSAIPVYLVTAEIWKEKLNNESKTIECFEEIIKIDPSRLDIQQKLYEYYNRVKNYNQVIISLQNILLYDPKKAEDSYLEIATLYRDNIKNIEQAIINFRNVLKVNPHQIIAIKALANLYEEQKSWAEYLEMIQKRLELSLNIEESISLYFAMCKVARLQNQAGAEEKSLLDILSLQFNQRQALEDLKILYKNQKNWEKYVHVLEREAQFFAWPLNELFTIYTNISQVYEKELKDFHKSIYFYEKALLLFPNSLETLTELERLYTQDKNYRNIIRIKEKITELSHEPGLIADNYYKIGEIYLEQLQEQENAIDSFERVVAACPENISSWQKLEILYQKHQKYEKLANCYFKQGQLSENISEKIERFIKCGQLYEEKLHNIELAIFYYEEVLHCDSKNLIAIERLMKLYQLKQQWLELCTIYQKKITNTDENQDIIRLCFELASLYRDKLHSPHKAIEIYNKILELDFSELEAINGLKEVYSQLEKYDCLEKITKTECSLTDDSNKKQELLMQMGQICEEKLFDYPIAISHYEAVLQHNPQSLDAILALRRLYYKIQDYPQVVATINDELQFTDSGEKHISLLFEKANICQNRLIDLETAIESYEKILTIDPSNHAAYREIFSIHYQQNSYAQAVIILEREIPNSSEDKQKELWTQSAKIRDEKLDDATNSKICLQQALAIDITYEPARNYLEILHHRLQEWPELIQHYQQELEFANNEERKAELLYNIGRLLEDKLNQHEQALAYYHNVVQIQPHNLITIKNIQKIYLEHQQYLELLDTYQKELAVPEIESERRIWVLLTCAELQRYYLEDYVGAIQNYLAVIEIELDPNNLQAIRGLQELYEKSGQYNDVQNMLFKELELQKDSNRLIMVHLQLACLMEEKLGSLDVAIEHFSEAHLSRPSNMPILQRLKKLLHTCKRWEAYTELVEKEILLCQQPLDRLPLHKDLQDVYDRELNLLDKAITHGEAALTIHEDDLDTIIKLESQYQRTNAAKKLVETFQRESNLWDSLPERLVFLHSESGKLLMNVLQDLPTANECFDKVIKLDPTNKDAIAALIQIRTQLKWWPDLINIYEYSAKITKNPEEIITLHLKIGELWEKELQNDSKALLSYQIVYTLDNKNYSAVNGMRKIFEREKRWGDAIEFLNVEVQLVDDKKKPPLYLKMGEYWEEKLNMLHQASTCYLKVMGHGFHRPTAERIMRIQEKVGDYSGLAEIIERDISVTQKPEEVLPKLLKLGHIFWKNLNNQEAAIDKYSSALKIDKKQMECLDALEELFTIQKKWKKLIQILNFKRDAVTDPEALTKIYLQLGEIYDAQLHIGNQAIKHYECAMELAPHNLDIIHILQRLYKEWGYYKKLIPLYQKEILIINNANNNNKIDNYDNSRILYLYGQIAECWERRLFEDEQSIRAYEKFAELDPENFVPIRALARLYKRCQYWDKMIIVYERLIAEALKNENFEEAIELLLDIGNMYRDDVNKPEEAIQSFCKVLELEPAHSEALQSLEKLYKSLNKPLEMAKLLQQKLKICKEDSDRIELYTHLGTLYEKELDDPDHAIEAFLYALQINPERLDVLKSLDWLYLRKKKWEELATICEKEIVLTNDANEKAELCYRLGIIKRDRFHSPDEARQLFLDANTYQPNMRKALKALRGLAILEENWTQAVKYISMEIAYIQEPSEKVEALTDLGSLYQNKLKLIQKAKEAFQMALEIDPKSIIAIESLADIHFGQKESTQAETLFGRLVLLVDKSTTEKLSNIYYKWGVVAETLNRKDDAIIRYSNSLDIKQDNLDSLVALGALYFERAQWGFDKAQWQEALNIYEKVYQHPKLEGDQKLEIIRRLAKIYSNFGQSDKAIEYYQKVLAQIPEEPASIQALSKLHIERGEDETALKYLQITARSETSTFQERRNAYLAIAEAQTRLERHREALEARLKALGMGVEDHNIFRSIGEGYIAVKDWNKAYEFLDKHYQCLDTSETTQKIENRCIVAKLTEEGFKQPEQAIQIYQEVLNIEPSWIPAIRGIAAIYEKQQKWDVLATAYQNFLEKLPEQQNQVALPIYISLGTLYFEKLNDSKAAIQQFTKALTIDPNHLAIHAALANIKATSKELENEAILEHLWLIEKEPVRLASYRNLHKLYLNQNHIDESLRSCRVLAVLGNVLESEQKFLANYPPRKIQPSIPLEILLPSLWKNQTSAHRDLMQLNADLMHKIYAVDLDQKYGLKRKDRLTNLTATTHITQTLWQAAEELRAILKIEAIDIYLMPKKSPRVYLENTTPPSLILSGPLLENLNEDDIRFIVAKYMFFLCQNQIFAYKLEPKELHQYFRLFRESILDEPTTHSAEDEALLKAIQKELQPLKAIFSTSKIKKKDLAERAELWNRLAQEDLNSYLREIDYASNRCALMFTDSLQLTISMIYRFTVLQQNGKLVKIEKIASQDLIKNEAILDILAFNLSEEYSKLRKQTGQFV